MPALEIRRDRTPMVLRKLAKAEDDARVARRLLAIANALDGMDRQTLRDWVIRYNEHGLEGPLDQWRGGRPPPVSEIADVRQNRLVNLRPVTITYDQHCRARSCTASDQSGLRNTKP